MNEKKPPQKKPPISTTFDKVPALSAARYLCASENPYFAKALWSFIPVEVEGLFELAGGHIATDKYWRLYFDPEKVQEWTPKIFANVLVHELQHNLKNHQDRFLRFCEGQGLSPEKAKMLGNVFEDCEINDDLEEEGKELPAGAAYPETIGQQLKIPLKKGDLFENYFLEYLKNYPPSPSPSGEGQNQGEEDSGKNGEEGNSPSLPNSNCGSGAHGNPEKWELSPNDPDIPSISPTEAEIIRKSTAEEILKHEKIRGNVPAHLKRWAEEKLSVKIDPRKELRAMIRNAVIEIKGKVNYSWRVASRRGAATPKIILPGLLEPVPDVVCLIDTSGSMSGKALGQAIAIVGKVLKSLGQQNVRVICVDAAMQATQKVFKPSQITLAGGGGTDMSIGLLHSETMKPKPHLVILITDAYTPWPDRKPKVDKVIICLVETTHTKDNCPSWAKVVKIEE